MATVAAIWRHPIKSHGREPLASVTLSSGQVLPGDRRWAVSHDMSKDSADAGTWIACTNFMIGTRTPGLAGIWARLHDDDATISLQHQDLGEITFCPDDANDNARFIDWVLPLCPDTRARPVRLARIGTRGWTDTNFPSISIMNTASHDAVSNKLDRAIERERWRGNFWLDGLPAWEEENWIGRQLRIGSAVVEVREPIVRCLHTAANPVTGIRDADTLGTLERGWGHKNFGVYAEVIDGGVVATGDKVEVIECN
jgi:uncharacterized protein YcbX